MVKGLQLTGLNSLHSVNGYLTGNNKRMNYFRERFLIPRDRLCYLNMQPASTEPWTDELPVREISPVDRLGRLMFYSIRDINVASRFKVGVNTDSLDAIFVVITNGRRHIEGFRLGCVRGISVGILKD